MILSEDVPHLLTMHRSVFGLTQPWAPRVQSNPMLEGGLKYAVVDEAMREKLRAEWNRKPLWPGLVLAVCVAVAGTLAFNVYRRS
jgi:hypothetical protein